MTLFEQYLAANRLSASGVVPADGDGPTALIDATPGEIHYLHGLLKTGIIFAALRGLTPVAYPSVRATRKQILVARSFCQRVAAVRFHFLKTVLLRLPIVVARVLRLKNKRDVLRIEIGGCRIGPYIYDACYRPLADNLTVKQRVQIAYLLFCHYMDRAVIDAYRVDLVLIGDPAYRTGMIFELCRARGIRCINAINVDILQMHKYFAPGEFDKHYRDVPDSAVKLVERSPLFEQKTDEYIDRRFTGSIQQHDVVRAFGSHKVLSSKAELCKEHGLSLDIPLVFVMAHVLSDAPHAYPRMLFQDYEEWLIRTVLALAKNKQVSFLVKEHPSAELYGEVGIVGQILDAVGLRRRLLGEDVHTLSVIANGGAIVTCGGTIGIEASVRGLPVVLAAKPPYAGKGFTVEPDSVAEYESLLATRIQHLGRLTEEQVQQAKQVAYVMFELFDNHAQSLELGRVPFVRGQRYDEESHYRNVIEEARVPLREQRLYQILERFHQSDDSSVINYDKLRTLR